MKDKFNRFMAGRYGTDELSKYMMWAAVAVMLVNLFVRLELLNIVVVALLVLIYVRMFSKNIRKRYDENCRFLALKGRVARFFTGKGRAPGNGSGPSAKADPENHIYRCPSCGQKIRIPRGKGKIIITCPKCGKEFKKKS